MFNPANDTHFSLVIEGVQHDLQVLEFKGREAISQPFAFDLELVSERRDLDLEELDGSEFESVHPAVEIDVVLQDLDHPVIRQADEAGYRWRIGIGTGPDCKSAGG